LKIFNLEYTSAHPKDHSCEVSLESDKKKTFMVTMAMAAILKMSIPTCTSTQPKDNSCEVSLQ
jgi:hypothetical protein